MRKEVQKFIEEHIDLIEDNNWKDFWKDVGKVFHNSKFDVGYLSHQLIKAGLDPIEGLNYIPEDFLCQSLVTYYIIPDTVLTIRARAFSETPNLSKIHIPSSVMKIEKQAFYGSECVEDFNSLWYVDKWVIATNPFNHVKEVVLDSNTIGIADVALNAALSLETLTIPDTLKYIGEYILFNASDLKQIIFNGTKSQWLAIKKDPDWASCLPGSNKYVRVICTDGDLKVVRKEV